MTVGTKDSIRVLRLRHVTAQLGISRSAVYDWMDPKSPRYDSTFPKPIRLGKASIGWLLADIERFIATRIAWRDSQKEGEP
ncbi:TPA: helix-turn-helix transcriptional regulator [Pseudomonas aeruginosa]|uniref:helix-turn-helix transcriptional regulator n=1 Tax=Pseudomonas aeruginosa TaxID=287 RepID=UPI000B48E8FC|nr:AlpA family phage regulatory protein [Pseudomonas aeruginosa]ELK4826546.1 AlpA family phage regulatory protein [Pseudomonas aeruginosa]ELM5704368.1 AlpA family phage regulatory protein [Pseudomonas aeruginosa]MBG5230017.1 AlpA family phage regulatory protein [Pseudomonas aeruginosa]MBH3618984.1 AlpA family phage regulatory protein [Pseudomonas aeruginosa]MBM2717283.1 AlpA family phage regulatory protein [Pseudomonas aeruginosa]